MQKNKLFEIAAAILCAVCLWMYVVTVVTPDDDTTITDIPVVFQGESELRSEHELIVSRKSASAVTVKFHGSRADLKQLVSNKGGITAVIDVTQFASERDYSAGYDLVLPSSIQENSVTVVDRSPRTVQFTVEKLSAKQVPVKGVFDGTLADGYVPGELSFDQDTVKVTGPSALVEQVNYAQVILGGDNVSQTVTRSVSITLIGTEGEPLRSNDLVISTQEIEVTLPVLMEKEVPVTLQPLYGGGASQENTELKILPEKVTIRGAERDLEDLTELSLGELDLAMILDGETLTLDIVPPEGVDIISGETQAQVTATFAGLEILEIPVTEIRTEHVSDELTAKIQTRSLMVTLRGPSEALIELSDEAVYAVADLSEYTEHGSFTVPVRIETGTQTIGAVGECTVTVELRAAQTAE